MHAGDENVCVCAYVITENKFRKALVLSLPLQGLLAVGWVSWNCGSSYTASGLLRVGEQKEENI